MAVPVTIIASLGGQLLSDGVMRFEAVDLNEALFVDVVLVQWTVIQDRTADLAAALDLLGQYAASGIACPEPDGRRIVVASLPPL